jgi:hypothetical protein
MDSHNKLLFWILFAAIAALPACHPVSGELRRIEILPNPFLRAASRPTLLAKNLNNPMSPQLIDGNVVLAQSRKGEGSRVSRTGGPIESLPLEGSWTGTDE